MYAFVKNGIVLKFPYTLNDLRQSYPNVSFPSNVDDAFLEQYGMRRVHSSEPPKVEFWQKVLRKLPEFVEGRLQEAWQVIDVSKEETEAKLRDLAAQVRDKRNQLLAESDWTMLSDAPVNDRQGWANYRHALRSVTTQAGFPWHIVWPDLPE